MSAGGVDANIQEAMIPLLMRPTPTGYLPAADREKRVHGHG
jgi:hypothetical protein